MIDAIQPPHAPKPVPQRREDLWRLSQAFEATFVAEMLKSAGINETSESFGGGVGEEAFSTLLTRNYADAFVQTGGIGLSEQIYSTLARREEQS